MMEYIRKLRNHFWLLIMAIKQYIEGRNYHASYEEAIRELEKFSPNPNTSSYCVGCSLGGGYDLTIIIPSYNNEKLLPICLNSVMSQQTEYNVQVIVINDGSADSTELLLEKYKALPNCMIVNHENRGFSGARNTGLELAEGKYIMFVDSDDILRQDAAEKLMRKALETDADVVAGNYITISFDGNRRFKGSKYKEQKVNPRGYLYGQPWGKVYKHDLFRNLHFPEGYWYEDSIFAQIVWPLANNVYTISDVVYEYRNNPKGISHMAGANHKSVDSLYITKALLEDKKKFGLELSKEDVDYFLKMVRLTFYRTKMHDGKIAKCIFIAQCELFKRFESIESMTDLNMQNALRNRDFKKYMKENALSKQ